MDISWILTIGLVALLLLLAVVVGVVSVVVLLVRKHNEPKSTAGREPVDE